MKQIPIKICNVYATDFPSMVFHQLEKEGEMDFSKRSIYEIYPSPIKSTYALKNLAKPGVFQQGTKTLLIHYQKKMSNCRSKIGIPMKLHGISSGIH